jgi:glycosyltransferase involved in cell wall biosynthesis
MYSVIIPAKNERLNLWYTLHNIRMIWDEWPDEGHELIVVDNQSTDQTAERLLDDPGIQPWVRRVETDRSGPGPVRQAGAEAARGEIFIFVDAHVLLSPDFFRKVCGVLREQVWDSVGSLHVPIGWNGGYRKEFSTHYTLTLDRDFWGANTAGGFTALTEVAAMGHGCVAVRRDHFFACRGYSAPFSEYGGDETYLDLKFAMFGYRNYTYPGAYCLHCSQRYQAYHWSHETLLRNNLLAACVLGGEEWAEKVVRFQATQPGVNPAQVQRLHDEARALAAQDRDFVRLHSRRNLDEVLADFARRRVAH